MSESYEIALVNKLINDFQKGERKSAFKNLISFVDLNPKNERARYNLAVMCEQLNDIELAKNHYHKIIKKNFNHWKSKFNLYLIFIKEQNYKKALNLVNEVLIIKKNYQPALRDKGVILYYLKKPDEGILFVEESLKLNPKDYIALNTLGLIYMEMKKYNLSIKIFIKAISLNEKYFPSYNNLGRCYEIKNDRKLALKNYKKALDLYPKFSEAINNIANCYNQSGLYSKAINFYNKALNLNPNKPEIIYNLGLAFTYLGKYEKAEALYKKAQLIIPNDDVLKKNYSILLLAKQRYKDAWQMFEGRLGLNEFRFKNSQINRVKKRLYTKGKIEKNNNILVIKEQGIGDEILYGSMYPDLIKKFPKVKIETEQRLIPLFKRSLDVENVFVPYEKYSQNEKKLKKFDKIFYAGSLGRLFRNKLSDFPKKSFLSANKEKFLKINNKINQITKKIKIGISWKSKNEIYGIDKSLDLTFFKEILKLKQFSFFNLQYGDTEKDLKNFKNKFNIEIININEVDLFNDFESIAALLKNLDLYIAISNSTAHLSGALGVPTWIIKPKMHAVFHYWNQSNNKTPWYSSVKLFTYTNNWDETMKEIKKELINKFT